MAWRTNMIGLDEQAKWTRESQPGALMAGSRFIANLAARTMVMIGPRDTCRFVRAWGLAADQAGCGPVAIPTLRKSKYLDESRSRLKRQLERALKWKNKAEESVIYWSLIVRNRYEAKGRHDKWYDDAKKHLAKVQRRLIKAYSIVEEARKELESLEEYGIVIGGRRWKKNQDLGLSHLARVRNKVYGGRGSISLVGGIAAVELTNLEAHSKIVESKYHVVARARAIVRQAGGREVAAIVHRRMRVPGLKVA